MRPAARASTSDSHQRIMRAAGCGNTAGESVAGSMNGSLSLYCSRNVNQLITPNSAALTSNATSIMTLARRNGMPTARSAANKMITRPATTSPDIHSALGIPRVLVLLSLVVLSSSIAFLLTHAAVRQETPGKILAEIGRAHV